MNFVLINLKSFYTIEKNSERYVLFADNIFDNSFKSYKFNNTGEIIVGKNNSSVISYVNQFVNDIHIKLTYNGKEWFLIRNDKSVVYINDKISNSDNLCIKNADVINIYGLKIVFVFNILFINNPLGNLIVNSSILSNIEFIVNDEIINEEIIDEPLYNDEDYFLKSPRIRRIIEYG